MNQKTESTTNSQHRIRCHVHRHRQRNLAEAWDQQRTVWNRLLPARWQSSPEEELGHGCGHTHAQQCRRWSRCLEFMTVAEGSLHAQQEENGCSQHE